MECACVGIVQVGSQGGSGIFCSAWSHKEARHEARRPGVSRALVLQRVTECATHACAAARYAVLGRRLCAAAGSMFLGVRCKLGGRVHIRMDTWVVDRGIVDG
eukprot:3760905-Pleurochrysis_carterae.AAC.3